MTTATINIPAPRGTTSPRGADFAAGLVGLFTAWLGKPASAVARRTRDAARVRALARSMQDSDPGMAADLYAAVARYEGDE